MIWIGRESVRTTVIMIATALDLSLQSVVTGMTYRLPVRPIPEEFEVALVRNNMIHTLGRCGLAPILMETT